MVRRDRWPRAVFGLAIGAWWLFIIGLGLGALALCGWIFEYYAESTRTERIERDRGHTDCGSGGVPLVGC